MVYENDICLQYWQDIRYLILIFCIRKDEDKIDEGIDILKSRENF